MRAAEDLGFDSVWPAEHHVPEYGFCASPALSLAAIASETKRIRLGTGIVILPLNHPLRTDPVVRAPCPPRAIGRESVRRPECSVARRRN